MTFKKGQSGNPQGRRVEKHFTDALRIAVNEEDKVTKKKKLRLIADKLVECAIEGQPWAIQQLADRIEGKPAQAPEDREQDANSRANSEERIARLAELALKLGASGNASDIRAGETSESEIKLPEVHNIN